MPAVIATAVIATAVIATAVIVTAVIATAVIVVLLVIGAFVERLCRVGLFAGLACGDAGSSGEEEKSWTQYRDGQRTKVHEVHSLTPKALGSTNSHAAGKGFDCRFGETLLQGDSALRSTSFWRYARSARSRSIEQTTAAIYGGARTIFPRAETHFARRNVLENAPYAGMRARHESDDSYQQQSNDERDEMQLRDQHERSRDVPSRRPNHRLQ